jgi:hypothetical protein
MNAWLLAHAAAASATLLLLLDSHSILSWITWHVSPVFGITGGSFFSIGVSADSLAGTLLTAGVLVIIPLVILGSVAQGIESLRRRVGKMAMGAVVIPGLIAGVAIWLFSASEDVDAVQRNIVAVSVGILLMLLSLFYSCVLAGVLRLLAQRARRADVA